MARNFSTYTSAPEKGYSETINTFFYPIELRVPDRVKESIPKRKLREIDGVFVFRFHPNFPMAIGHTLTRCGHRWAIVGIEHRDLQVKGSRRSDSFPKVITKYIGAV